MTDLRIVSTVPVGDDRRDAIRRRDSIRRLIAGVALGAALTGCAGREPLPVVATPPVPMYTDFRDLSDVEKKIIAKGAAAGLKDPQSANFRWAKYPKVAEVKVRYCVMINAKNSYGGYTGFQAHVVFVTQANGRILDAILDDTDRGTAGGEIFCREHGMGTFTEAKRDAPV